MYTSHFLYPFISPQTFRPFLHLGYFDNAAVNKGVHTYLWYPDFSCFGQMSRSEVVKSYGSSIFVYETSVLFSIKAVAFLLLTTVHKSSCFSISCQHLLFSGILILAILTGTRIFFIVVLIFISVMIIDIWHLFINLLATCMFSMEKLDVLNSFKAII